MEYFCSLIQYDSSGNIDLKPIPYGKIFLLANSPPNKKIVIRRVDIKVILFFTKFYFWQ